MVNGQSVDELLEVISEDINKAQKQTARVAGYDFSGLEQGADEPRLYSLRYSTYIVLLAKAVQERQQMIEKLHT